MRRTPGRSFLLYEFPYAGVKVGRVKISSGFLLLCSWLLYRDRNGVVWQGLLACVLHELGHLAALFALGSEIKEIKITVFGAKMKFNDHLSYAEEAVAAAAGPFVNLVLAFICSRLHWLYPFAGVNFALAVFNLLPVGTLDGGRLVGCLAAQFGNQQLSDRIVMCVTYTFTAIFGIVGVGAALFWRNLTLLIMCFWLIFRRPTENSANFNKKNRNRACQTMGKQLK